MDQAREKEIEEEYLSSLMDLNVNSKPLINMLTMLAEDNIENAHVIVKAVEMHLAKVSPDVKLPILYLIDSIVKNVGDKYKQLFAQNIVNMFCGVFEKVNEKVREKMFNLRMTWNEVFPQTKLYALDVKVNVLDNNWPITAKVVPKSVHVNPNFLKNQPPPEAQLQTRAQEDLLKQMKEKERELLELKQRKIELELMVTKKKIAESEKEIRSGFVNPSVPVVPVSLVQSTGMPGIMIPPPAQQGRVRIAPVSAGMISTARSRDPRLLRMRQNVPSTTISHSNMPPSIPSPLVSLSGSSLTKSLPRIPKFSQQQANNKMSRDEERDPRIRKSREDSHSNSMKMNKNNSQNTKSRSSHSSKNSSSKSSERKKSGSSDDTSPRKRNDEEKKSARSSSSHHHKSSIGSKSRSSKSPSKMSPPNNSDSSKDVDLRFNLSSDALMKPDSTTNPTSSKSNKDKLLTDLLNDEDLKSSHDIPSDDNGIGKVEPSKYDTDLRSTNAGIEGGKKRRSISDEPLESEPSIKKNRAETDLLFGNQDVDLRTLGEASEERRSKSKEKADFEAVRAKLNATKEKAKLRGGIKLLDELPKMPPGENGTAELVRKILGRKDTKIGEVKIDEESTTSQNLNTVEEEPEIVNQPPPMKQQKFNNVNDERIDEVPDMGNLTAAELRKPTGKKMFIERLGRVKKEISRSVPASIRKEKRKNSKWNQPNNNQWPLPPMNTNIRPPMPMMTPPTHNMMPHHFLNPWESNPMVMQMQKQSQMPLVLPQSISQPVLNNKMRTLRLDGTKDHLLRFYHETAIIFNDLGEPHDIKFSAGQSRVIIDDQYSIDLNFNDSYKSFLVESNVHQIKFGSPTRELYIDNNFYECYFNNQPTQIVLNDKLRMVRIEGKAPEVKIGRKRSDLVLGLINIVIDAEIMVPVFLDTTIQYFEFKGQIYSLQFADFFLTVVINNEIFKVEFGGTPKKMGKHFIRFTVLPDNVQPGRVNMLGMRRTHLSRGCKSPPLIPQVDDALDINMLVENDMRTQQPQQQNENLIPSQTLPAMNVIPGIGHEAVVSTTGPASLNVPNLDINDLLKKLVATGIIGGSNSSGNNEPTSTFNNESKEKSPEVSSDDTRKGKLPQIDDKRNIQPVLLSRPETIKKRQAAIIDTLYSGIQCSSCGLRFPPEQTMKYSQHLDWHFRQNRRERDSKRRAHFRKWYYNQSDWIKYEEIEDLEEREKNFFEAQQMESMADQGDESNFLRGPGGSLDNAATISCPAGPDNDEHCCEMCHDKFETFFNEETEEWHLRSALKVDNKFYHPICYEDYKASLTFDESGLMEASAEESKVEEDLKENSNDVVIKQENEEDDEEGEKQIARTDDDDDVIMLPPEEPVVTEILDESEMIDEKVDVTIPADDDVMINEPKIETQLVPDDDDDDDTNDNHVTPSDDNSEQNLIVKIKEEPKDDGYEDLVDEEDAFVEVTEIAIDDAMQDDAYINSPQTPFQPAHDDNAVFDDSSLLPSPPAHDEHSRDVDDDNNSRPESSGAQPSMGRNKKLKIVLSSLAQSSLSNKNLNSNSNVNDQNENSNLDSVNKLDSNSVDLQSDPQKDHQNEAESRQDEPEISYEVKPELQSVKFEKISVPVRRGVENSGLCSIM